MNVSGEFVRWLLEQRYQFEVRLGEPVNLTDLARLLDVGQAALSTWINGTRKPSYQTLAHLAAITGDYSVLGLWGYSDPRREALPPALLEAFDGAVAETLQTFKEKGVSDPSSSLAMEIAKEAFSKHGFIVTR